MARLPVLFLLLTAPAALPAQAADSGAFVITLGTDTIAVERYTRSRDELRDDMVLRDRSPVTTRRLVAMLRPDGSVARLEFDTRAAGGAKDPPAMHGVATFTTEETFFEVTRGGETRRATVVTPGGAMPFLNFCYGLYEQIGRRAHALGGASVEVPAIWFGASLPFTLTVTFPSPDSMTVGFGDQAPTLMNVDAAGRILRADGRLTTQKVTVARVPGLDFAALRAALAPRPLGPLSPADSVRADLVGAAIVIEYSRPARRGRKIFGGLVPWNEVWRTGANAATRLTTSADLVMGGRTIPKGSYTLWTLPTPTGWKLIINTQTKAPCEGATCTLPTRPPLWGTTYSADSDLVRLDLTVEQLPQPVEVFTISIELQGGGGAGAARGGGDGGGGSGVLKMEWENTRVSIPFTRK